MWCATSWVGVWQLVAFDELCWRQHTSEKRENVCGVFFQPLTWRTRHNDDDTNDTGDDVDDDDDGDDEYDDDDDEYGDDDDDEDDDDDDDANDDNLLILKGLCRR